MAGVVSAAAAEFAIYMIRQVRSNRIGSVGRMEIMAEERICSRTRALTHAPALRRRCREQRKGGPGDRPFVSRLSKP